MSNDNLRKPLVFLNIILLLIIAGIAYHFLNKKSSIVTIEKTISGVELRDKVYVFLQKQFFETMDKEDSAGKPGPLLKCSHEGCSNEGGYALPDYAWGLLAHARMLENPNIREQSLKSLKSYTLEITTIGPADNKENHIPQYSSHQLYETYQATGDYYFLYWFWDFLKYAENFTEVNILSRLNQAKANFPNIYLLSTLARELSQGVLILNDPKTKEILVDKKEIEAGDVLQKSETFLNQSIELTRLVENLRVSGQSADSAFEPLVESNQNFSQTICWEYWAKTSIALAAKSIQNQKDSITAIADSYKDQTKEFFNQILFSENSPRELNFKVLQSVLPCIHAAYLLENNYLEEAKFYKAARVKLIEKYILPNWDFGDNACNDDGGLLSNLDGRGLTNCSEGEPAVKSMADNSWLVYLLDSSLSEAKFKLG